MQRQMGAKTSENFWHIILGHGHCGGVGAQRFEILIIIIIIIIIVCSYEFLLAFIIALFLISCCSFLLL